MFTLKMSKRSSDTEMFELSPPRHKKQRCFGDFHFPNPVSDLNDLFADMVIEDSDMDIITSESESDTE